MRLRLLSASEVRRAMPMADAIRIVREAFLELSAGRAAMPVRTQIPIPESGGISLHMPAHLPGPGPVGKGQVGRGRAGKGQLATKIVSVFPRNPDRSPPLPTIHALVLALDAETGVPLGALEGGTLTAIRTGAASGVATAELAPEDVETAAVLGAGIQARTQLEAMVVARPGIRRALVFDIRPEASAAFAREMSERLAIPVTAAARADDAVAAADVIAEATTASAPVFSDSALRPRAHLNAVGSFTPAMQIIPPETVVRAKVVVDHRESCWEEAGDLIRPRDAGLIDESHVLAEIGEIAAGTAPRPEGGPVLFKTVGTAVQDVAVAAAALARAEEQDLGVVVDL